MNAPARIAELERQLHWAQLEIQALREELRQRRIQQLGPKSETLSNLQLALLTEEEPSTTRDEVEAEARRETLTRAPSRERRPHPGRKPLPEDLPRVTHVLTCNERTCASCGEETAVIGYDESEQLDVEPARYFVRVTKREKRACRRCSTVTAAPLAERIVEKGLASDAVVINTVGGEVLRPPAVVPASGDDGARGGRRDRTRDAGRLGDACGRTARAHRGSDASRSARRILFTGR